MAVFRRLFVPTASVFVFLSVTQHVAAKSKKKPEGGCMDASTCAEDEVRAEKDGFGEIMVPNWAYWGAATQRSYELFKISTDRMPAELIRAFGIQKEACAEANSAKLGKDKTKAIQEAAQQVAKGKLNDHFPLVVYQTGSGTQTNMNVNEVIANLANEKLGEKQRGTKKPVHPNDHVNMAQSTNDGFPTAMHIAAVLQLREKVYPALLKLEKALGAKAKEFKDIVKVGRTHLQDATPITLGQEFSAWEMQVHMSIARFKDVEWRLQALAQGGTAVGTGLNTEEGWDKEFAQAVGQITGIFEFRTNPNKFEGIASHDAITELASMQSTVATSLMKIANDIRLLGSGPNNGIGEIFLPSNEAGSSIMPGKVNPTQAEALSMAASQIIGNSVAVQVANTQGHLDLNAFKPVMIFNVLKSGTLIADAANSFVDHCVVGITPNEKRIKEHLDKNLMTVTALNAVIGYDNGKKVVAEALSSGDPLRVVAVEKLKVISGADFDAAMDPSLMVGPTKTGPKRKKYEEL